MERLNLRWTVGSWGDLGEPAARIRKRVFCEEMGIDEAIDLDGTDPGALHVVVFEGENPVGTGRLLWNGAQIGRMAVLRARRGQGVGSAMLTRLLREAVRAGMAEVQLHAQSQAIGFYRRHGFQAVGTVFEDAGIPHQCMWRELQWLNSVAGALVRGGRVLLGLRASHLSMGNHWDLFGGKLEAGEDPETALRRELTEELSVEIEPDALVDVVLYDDGLGRGLWRCPVYRITTRKGEAAINEEHQEMGWFTPAEMENLRLAHPRLPRLARRMIDVEDASARGNSQ